MSKIVMALALTSILLSACAREETGEGEGTAVMEDTTAAAPELVGISLAEVAGTWVVNARSETGQQVPQFELVATADPSGWEIRFPDRDPIPVTVVEVAGDSIVTEAGPYESVLRPGVQVSTHAVYRIEGDLLVGTTVASYQTSGADSVAIVHSEGTRAP
jgi:hypothetical protein